MGMPIMPLNSQWFYLWLCSSEHRSTLQHKLSFDFFKLINELKKYCLAFVPSKYLNNTLNLTIPLQVMELLLSPSYKWKNKHGKIK